ncbi:pheST operon leader peptide PheM [Escherichia coli]|nr:pheST operon leader peptide PheM [Salmonella enterica subsp. enterica serovar Infantis]EKI3322831.1 pheST operon leader peptide PheM [Salmonella enterica]WMO74066.1 pheST operon leader peptide PheM [Escherichia coli]
MNAVIFRFFFYFST